MLKPPREATRKRQHRFEGSTCCLEGKHRLNRRLGGSTTQAISNAEEGSLLSRPSSKNAELLDVRCAPVSYGGYKPHANLVRTRDTSPKMTQSPRLSCHKPKEPPRGATITDEERTAYHLSRPQPACIVLQVTPPRRKRHSWRRRRLIQRILGLHPGPGSG
jgi:hypothetical protein